MGRKRNIISIDQEQQADGVEPEAAEVQSTERTVEFTDAPDETYTEPYEEAWEEEQLPRRNWGWLIPTLALLTIAVWSAFFAWVNQVEMLAGAPSQQWLNWISTWSMPVILVVMVWILSARHSTREAQRFGEAAQLLSAESASLEERLHSINRELSMARDFIASQSRDLESLGRVASERLSENAAELQGLIHNNGEQVNAIGAVSDTALANMDKLRDQLPVISNSARDLANQIGNAGNTAESHLEEMTKAFVRLNEFGEASERQVGTLGQSVDQVLASLEDRISGIEANSQQRHAALRQQSEELRLELETQETDSLAAIQRRSAALAAELASVEQDSRERESEVIAEVQQRLLDLKNESETVISTMRDGHAQTEVLWQKSIDQFRNGMKQAIDDVSQVDERSIANAQHRLDVLSQAADRVDASIKESADAFETEFARRREQHAARESEAMTALEQRISDFDARNIEKQEEHLNHMAGLVERGESLARRLTDLDQEIARISEQGKSESSELAEATEHLADRLSQNRALLDESKNFLSNLTDDSVRLLEIIRSSSDHSEGALSNAIGNAESRLSGFQEKVESLQSSMQDAENRGASLTSHIDKTSQDTSQSLSQIQEIEMRLNTVAAQSRELSEQSKGELQQSIATLGATSEETLEKLRRDQAAVISEIGANIGSEAASSIDRAMREGAARAIEELEETSKAASERGRDTAAQLRDQLALVSELTSNLEQRVSHAREAAEEQVNSDFTRSMALITDSLNSTSIDISKAFEAEVSDSAWSSYLRGDRGIFTRRAVKLLDQNDVREMSDIYEMDEEFRAAVNRYIHDFEAMLRSVLSTRDGNAIGVTLLSSDIGKLYVALAQAIERLRN